MSDTEHPSTRKQAARARWLPLVAFTLAANGAACAGTDEAAPRTTAGGGTAAGGGAAGAASTSSAGSSAGGKAATGGTGGAEAAGVSGAGSAGANAGSAGAGPTDFCAARPGLTFCETFEAQPTGMARAWGPWTPSVNGEGQVTIDDSVAHGGKNSLKVHGSGFSSFLVLSGASALPPSPGPLFVRAFVRLESAMTTGHNTFIVADRNDAPGAGNAFRLGEMNAMLMYTVSGDTHGALANDDFYTDHLPGAALKPLEWSCLEVALDPTKPEIRVWLDGTEIADLHHTDWTLDPYDAVRFGFEKYAGPVSDVWYDDIAVGAAALSCD
jgi:hypothetical protein